MVKPLRHRQEPRCGSVSISHFHQDRWSDHLLQRKPAQPRPLRLPLLRGASPSGGIEAGNIIRNTACGLSAPGTEMIYGSGLADAYAAVSAKAEKAVRGMVTQTADTRHGRALSQPANPQRVQSASAQTGPQLERCLSRPNTWHLPTTRQHTHPSYLDPEGRLHMHLIDRL